MEFEWDERKRLKNIRKHHIDFKHILPVFETEMVEWVDTREDYGEERIFALGQLEGHLIVALVYIEKGSNIIRIISARRATKHEKKEFYHRVFGTGYPG